MLSRSGKDPGGALVCRRWPLALAAGIMLAAVSACDESTAPDATTVEQVAYIDGIVPHHQIAIMRADEALAKASRPGMKTLAQRVKSDQTAEIAELKATRIRLTGSDETPPAMMPQPIPAGPEFERMWATMMIVHHQGAIDMSRLALGAGVPFPLDTLARHAIQAQEREQQELRDSLMVWYAAP